MSGDLLTRSLAERAVELSADDIPGDVMEIAAQCFLDWYSLAYACHDHPAVQPLKEFVLEGGGAPQAALVGGNGRCRTADAAWINGTASHVLDFDDAHLPSRVHPSVPLWPAILALCESREASGRDLLAAFVAGVEVQSRLARVMGASHYRLGWHSTATLGSFGATAAAARLLGLDVPQCMHAFGLNATQAAGLRAMFGTPCKPLHVGRAAANGVVAAELVRRGCASQPDILDRPDGYPALAADAFDPRAAFARPDHWEARDIVFKFHASCYGTQAPIEACLAAMEALDAHAAGGGAVDSVSVTVETQYLSVCNIPEPADAAESKFSVRHAVALVLAGRDTLSEASFSPEACADPVLRALRAKVRVEGSDGMPRAHADVDLRLSDGRACLRRFDASAPETDLVRQARRLREKSSRLLAPLLDGPRISALQDGLLAVGDASSVARWHAGLREGAGP